MKIERSFTVLRMLYTYHLLFSVVLARKEAILVTEAVQWKDQHSMTVLSDVRLHHYLWHIHVNWYNVQLSIRTYSTH